MRTFGVIALLLLPTIANAQTETTRANRLSVGAMTEPAVGTVRLTGLGSVGSPHPQPIRGMLRHDGQVFLDDTGPINPVFLHAGDLISRWARGHHTEVRHILDLATRTGYAGIRVWTCLGGGEYWRSRKVVASRELLRSFLNELRARDLKAILSQGDMWNFTDPWAYADVIRDVLDPSVIAIVDAGNEAWQTGQRDPRELARTRHHRTWPGVRPWRWKMRWCWPKCWRCMPRRRRPYQRSPNAGALASDGCSSEHTAGIKFALCRVHRMNPKSSGSTRIGTSNR